jgi:hypothetical protein
MSPIKLGLLPCAVLALFPARAALGQEAQPDSTVLSGNREVRVTAPAAGLDRRRAIYRGVRDSALLIQLDTMRSVPLSQIERLELLVGTQNGSRAGMKIGMIVGVAAGVAAGIAGKASCDRDPDTEPAICSVWLVGGPTGGFALGAIVGTIIGGARKSDLWRDVPVSSLSFGPAPRARGMRLSLTLKF